MGSRTRSRATRTGRPLPARPSRSSVPTSRARLSATCSACAGSGRHRPSWWRAARRSTGWRSVGCAGRSATGRTPRPGCCGRPGPRSPCPGCSGCTATAGSARSGRSSSSTSGPGQAPAPRGSGVRWYAGRAPANDLARRGHAVLVHDTFSWGSRRFDLSRPTPGLAARLAAQEAAVAGAGGAAERGRAVRRGVEPARGHAGQGGRRARPDLRRDGARRRPRGVGGPRRGLRDRRRTTWGPSGSPAGAAAACCSPPSTPA